MEMTHRLANATDLTPLAMVMEAAIEELQKPYLSLKQIEASRVIMGLDSQLIADGTYFVVEFGDRIAGCGGWSRRATLYGGDRSPGRNAALLDPQTDAARVRAMYTHPDFARRGVGRRILQLCEDAAAAEGFATLELMATKSGVPLYSACGYLVLENIDDSRGGIAVPLTKMRKVLADVSGRKSTPQSI